LHIRAIAAVEMVCGKYPLDIRDPWCHHYCTVSALKLNKKTKTKCRLCFREIFQGLYTVEVNKNQKVHLTFPPLSLVKTSRSRSGIIWVSIGPVGGWVAPSR